LGDLVCSKCNARYSLNDKRWRCDCGGYLNIEFDAEINIEKIGSRAPTMWRYKEAIPLDDYSNIVSFNEGFTPLTQCDIYSKKAFLKLDYLFPSGSYKDRGASVLISKAKEAGVDHLIEDSSGNAGCAVASYAAKADIGCDIYVPQDTSAAKLSQIQAYGADLHMVSGSRSDTSDAALKAAEHYYYASHTWNPFFLQGTKTFAYEIWEQLNFNAPDILFIPTGNGTLLIGAYIGFCDLKNNHLIKNMPKFIAVQSENCAPVYKLFKENLSYVPEINNRPTIAEGIAINKPLRGRQIAEVISKTNGDIVTVSDDEIKKSLVYLSKIGLYVEPTSASVVAAFSKYKTNSSDITILPLTGNGLKSNEKILHILKEIENEQHS